MTISKFSTLVSAKWLQQQILPNARKMGSELRVLDTSWNPAPNVDGYEMYKEGHIPTSLHFDLKEVQHTIEGSPQKFTLPEPKLFKEYVEELGISNRTHVVLYDRMLHRPAFRSWFFFRLFGHDKISVLNGGLKQWLTEGYHVTMEELEVQPGEFHPNFRRDLLRSFETMTKNMSTRTEQVVDSRGADSFVGSAKDSTGGHIPGALNIPVTSFLYEDGTFKSEEDLKKLFDSAGVNLTKPMVATCQTATTACTLAAGAFMLGKEVPVYNGSFTEWSKLADPQNIVRLKTEE